MLLSRAALINEAIGQAVFRVLKENERALEQSIALSKITIEIHIGRRSGDPVKIGLIARSDYDFGRSGV